MCSQIISELNLGFSQQNPVLKTATCLTENETEELQLQAAPVLLLRPPLAAAVHRGLGLPASVPESCSCSHPRRDSTANGHQGAENIPIHYD